VNELNVRDLPTYPSVRLTGEIGISRIDGVWERDGQQFLGPLSKLILDQQPDTATWISAACCVTGWSPIRVLAFQTTLSHINVKWSTYESEKGVTDAALYGLLHKLARKTNQYNPNQNASTIGHARQ